MSFPQRIINTALTFVFKFIVRDLYALPKAQAMLEEAFPDDQIPHIDDLIRNTALLINHGTPFLGDGLRPVMPKTILAGFMSCHSPSPLPDDLAQWVEGSEHGVIFVSFGSVIKSSKMPEGKRKAMLKVFSKLKQRIIWKWEKPMPDAPENVLISSWLPQTSLLAHEKVKVFVTHGGAGSIQETICHKTPIVGVPIAMDQKINIQEAVNKKYAVRVKWHEVTEESFSYAIEEVLTNPSYKEAISELSNLIMDQPQHPLERAVWWLEYLLRHPHNSGMESPTHQLYWFQYFLLDILAIFIAGVIVLFMIFKKLIAVCRRKTEKID